MIWNLLSSLSTALSIIYIYASNEKKIKNLKYADFTLHSMLSFKIEVK